MIAPGAGPGTARILADSRLRPWSRLRRAIRYVQLEHVQRNLGVLARIPRSELRLAGFQPERLQAGLEERADFWERQGGAGTLR